MLDVFNEPLQYDHFSHEIKHYKTKRNHYRHQTKLIEPKLIHKLYIYYTIFSFFNLFSFYAIAFLWVDDIFLHLVVSIHQ